MSMTLEEAIEKVKILCAGADELSSEYEEQGSFIEAGMAVTFKNAFDTILSALRPVSREQVEKVWRGKWIKELRQTYIPVEYDEQGEVILHDFVVYHCSICGRENTKEEPFCNCGAPMTDEAVEMVLERMALKDAKR